MTNFSCRTVASGQDLAVQDDSSAYSGTQSNHNNAVKSSATSAPLLSESRYVCIIAHFDLFYTCQLTKLIRYGENAPSQICTFQHTSILCNRSRHTHANTNNITFINGLFFIFVSNRLRNIRQDQLAVIFLTCHDLPFLQHIAFLIKKPHFYCSST